MLYCLAPYGVFWRQPRPQRPSWHCARSDQRHQHDGQHYGHFCALCYSASVDAATPRHGNRRSSGDSAHGALSTAMVIMAFAQLPIDLHSLLFGDILTVTIQDLIIIALGGALILGIIFMFWPSLLLITINEDLAKAEGVNTLFLNIIFLFLIASTVAISVRMVGVLLITSMLIIPASTARQFASTPIHMAIMAALTGIIAVVGGMTFSLETNTPTGPSMVLCLSVLFALSLMSSRLITRIKAHILK